VVHCRQLGQIANFTGNEKDYYDPDNSCVNMVLQRRTGIPITLGLLYMAVAQRLGLSLHGLNLPGHLMVGNSVEGVTNLLVEPFDGNGMQILQMPASLQAFLDCCSGKSDPSTAEYGLLHVQGAAKHQAVPSPMTGTFTAYTCLSRLIQHHCDHLHSHLNCVQTTWHNQQICKCASTHLEFLMSRLQTECLK